MRNSSKFLAAAALISVLVLSLVTESDSVPGHLVHDFYKCESEYFRAFFKRCKRNTNSSPNVTSSNMILLILAVGASFIFTRT